MDSREDGLKESVRLRVNIAHDVSISKAMRECSVAGKGYGRL